ncbi:hypothetical protein [Devosia sp.]|uniref:hypothetical protein n=1 Tax=Devosia sp. TaxID=1871048 RepID=UPI002736D08B|nr:hypothetical protein [Devosia sp.]MDP2780481.1 hypothetical protein [Devosia sp.]
MIVETKGVSQPNDTVQPVSDDEIVADLFRLARSGQYLKAKPLLAAGALLYPQEPKKRIKNCLVRLGEILWDTDHGGFATEYKLDRRHQRSSLTASA